MGSGECGEEMGEVRSVVILAALACGVATASQSVVFSFEDGEKGWSVDGKVCRFCDGVGLKNGRALLWQNDDTNVYQYASRDLKLRPGCIYEYSAWVKTERIDNPVRKSSARANVSIEWRDTNGKWISLSMAKPVVDNQLGKEGWVHFMGRTPQMPENLGKATLVCSVFRGGVGRVVFDGAEVKLFDSDPVWSLLSSAYRDEAVAGRVSFAGRCSVDPLRDPPESLTGEFIFVGNSGELRIRATVEDDWSVRTEVDVRDLAYGTNPVRLELRRKDGGLVGAREMTFTHLEKPLVRKVFCDRFGRLIVDGKPFSQSAFMRRGRKLRSLTRFARGLSIAFCLTDCRQGRRRSIRFLKRDSGSSSAFRTSPRFAVRS